MFSQTLAQPQVNIVPYTNGIYGKISDIASNGDGRLFVATQLGYIYIVNAGGSLDTVPFLNINNKVTPTSLSNTGEQGLLGLAFSPNYSIDSSFYVYYTNKVGHGNSVIARYKVSNNPNLADTSSAEILFALAQPYTNHNGGCMKFGSDGYLYIALGDGGDAGDPGNRAQNMNLYFGKILRIDVSQPGPYTIPTTNPYAGVLNIKQEIWASGLRNPWKFSFDRMTHDFWMGDVGQDIWEELNYQSASSNGGENYGWRCYEGLVVYDTSAGCNGNYTAPIHVYSHAATGGCSITGGFVYRGTANTFMYGYYFFADFCNGTIYVLDPNNNTVSIAGVFPGKAFSTFGEDDNGELYVADLGTGTLYKVKDTLTGKIGDNELFFQNHLNYDGNKNILNIALTSSKNITASATISDMNGRLITEKKLMFQKGKNSHQIQTLLTNGIYIFSLSSDKHSIRNKFVVVR
jgi:glucose/arabinose dehydrogenase